MFSAIITKISDGKKLRLEKWINIEITDEQTNHDLVDPGSKYGKDVQDFLNAEQEFKKFMEMESDGNL